MFLLLLGLSLGFFVLLLNFLLVVLVLLLGVFLGSSEVLVVFDVLVGFVCCTTYTCTYGCVTATVTLLSGGCAGCCVWIGRGCACRGRCAGAMLIVFTVLF